MQKQNMKWFLKHFFSLICPIFKNKWDKWKISWLFKHFFGKIQPNMAMQERKRQRIYDLLYAESNPKNIPEKIGVSLWPPYSLDLNPLKYTVENKTNIG